MRDTNKLTSESSSLNLKTTTSTIYIRSHIHDSNQNNVSLKSTDTSCMY